MSEFRKKRFSETLEKGLGILSLFDELNQGFTLTEISRSLGINKTSIYRYLNTYCKLGYLRKDPQSKQFKLGPQSIALAHSFMMGSDLLDLVKPLIDETYHQHWVAIDVGLLHNDSIYCIYRKENKDILQFRRIISGKGLHFLSTGKAAMAFLPDEDQLSLLERLDLEKKTSKTITTKSKLSEELKRTRKRGYATNCEEYIPGLLAVGAPLINLYTNQVQGAVSFMGSTASYTMKSFEKKFAGILVALAKRISALLPPS